MLHNRIKFFKDQVTSKSILTDHYYITLGYKIPIGENFKIEPSALIKYAAPAKPQVDASLRAIYKDKFWIGATYRTEDAISAMVGYTFRDHFTFGYSYDMITSNLKSYSSGTHEIVIGIRFVEKKIKSGPPIN